MDHVATTPIKTHLVALEVAVLDGHGQVARREGQWRVTVVVGARIVLAAGVDGPAEALCLLADEDGVGDAEDAPAVRLDRAPAALLTNHVVGSN